MNTIGRLFVLLKVLLLTGCSGTPAPPIYTYEGEIQPDHKVATLYKNSYDWTDEVTIDGEWYMGVSHFKLLPGKHIIGFSLNAGKTAGYVNGCILVDMKVGHDSLLSHLANRNSPISHGVSIQ